MINANIGVGAHAWKGADGTAGGGKANGSGDVFNKVAANAATAAEKTIGILGDDFYDQGTNRASVKALAFRAFKQHYAYWPDSTVTSRDRKNVREGRYAIWGYVHMLLQMSGTTPVSTVGKYFVDLIQGTLTPAPSFDATDTIVDGHLMPVCAMKVTRDIEGGPQKAYCRCGAVRLLLREPRHRYGSGELHRLHGRDGTVRAAASAAAASAKRSNRARREKRRRAT